VVPCRKSVKYFLRRVFVAKAPLSNK
jgi:hypothetical protein